MDTRKRMHWSKCLETLRKLPLAITYFPPALILLKWRTGHSCEIIYARQHCRRKRGTVLSNLQSRPSISESSSCHFRHFGRSAVPSAVGLSTSVRGGRTTGGQRKCYKDSVKSSLKAFEINDESWESLAAERGT